MGDGAPNVDKEGYFRFSMLSAQEHPPSALAAFSDGPAAANFMTFWEAFFRVILLRPGQALGALYWHLTRRRMRARNQIRRGAALLPNAHYFWIRTREERPDHAERLKELEQRQARLPRFEIVVANGGDSAAIGRTLKSLQ